MTCDTITEPTAIWIGFQEGYGDLADFDLYNLKVTIPGHCAGSTVTATTLRMAGLEVPTKELP